VVREVGMTERRLLVVLIGINVVLVAALLARTQGTAAASPETVRAKAIELVDEHGQVRAQLNVESSGEAVFRLRDSKGQIRVKLDANGDGSGLLLLDESTEPAIHMLAKRDGPSMTMMSKRGQRRTITP
jgi:hypothetical protein